MTGPAPAGSTDSEATPPVDAPPAKPRRTTWHCQTCGAKITATTTSEPPLELWCTHNGTPRRKQFNPTAMRRMS